MLVPRALSFGHGKRKGLLLAVISLLGRGRPVAWLGRSAFPTNLLLAVLLESVVDPEGHARPLDRATAAQRNASAYVLLAGQSLAV